MPKYKKVSKNPAQTRLLVGDKSYINKMMDDLKSSDPNYQNMSAAIRHYVHIGITAEQSQLDVRGSLENIIVRTAIKEALRFELKSYAGHVNNLTKAVTQLEETSAATHRDLALRAERADAYNRTAFERLFSHLEASGKMAAETYRNLIVLRTIQYIFLLGYKTGRIDESAESIGRWITLVRLAHDKANKLSVDELKELTAADLEGSHIAAMAKDIFDELRNQK